MKSGNPRILTINGGSSSIKFALFEAGDPLLRIMEGEIERIGFPEAAFRVKGLNPADDFSRLRKPTPRCKRCSTRSTRVAPRVGLRHWT